MLPLDRHPPGENDLHIDVDPGSVLDQTEAVHVDPIVVTVLVDRRSDVLQQGDVGGVHGLVDASLHHAYACRDDDHAEHGGDPGIEPSCIVSHALGDVDDDQTGQDAHRRVGVRAQVLAARLQRRGPVPPALCDRPPPDDVVRRRGEGDQDQTDIELVGELLRVDEGLRGLVQDEDARDYDHRPLYGGGYDLDLPMTERMSLVRGLGREVQGVDAHACGHDIDDGLRGICEDRHRSRQGIGHELDDQEGETQQHHDLLEFVVLLGGVFHDKPMHGLEI